MVLRSKKVLSIYQTTGSVSTRQEKDPGDMTVVSLPLSFVLLQSFLKGREGKSYADALGKSKLFN